MIASRPAESAVQDASADAYEAVRYSEPASHRYHAWLATRLLARLSPAARRGPLLDAGCGTGFLVEAFGAAARDAVVGVDLSRGMLRFARARLPRLARADVLRLPFRDGAFRAVVARGLLHHVAEAAAAVDELRRVLAPGGEIVLMEPQRAPLARAVRRLFQRPGRFAETHRDFRADELRALLARAFTVERVEPLAFLGYPLAFPDVAGIARALRLGARTAAALAAVDERLERVPGLGRHAWALVVAGRA